MVPKSIALATIPDKHALTTEFRFEFKLDVKLEGNAVIDIMA